MTANSRYVFADHWKGIVEWIIGDHSANFLAPLTREIFDKCDDYECARDELSHAQLVTPVYFIVSSGEKPGELENSNLEAINLKRFININFRGCYHHPRA